jgi:hypothetical protein
MSQAKHTILESWPGLKEDLGSFLSCTDTWIISTLKEAHEAKDWEKIPNIIDVMELVHDMHHSH